MLKNFKQFNFQKMNISSEVISDIKTFIFLDLETTGLPLYENNSTRITELCLTAVQAEHIRLGVFPRVQNKLNLCFNPCKLISVDSEKITGLSNDLLENSCRFSQETVSAINNFLNHSPQPACFVAHNGLKFDYPILRREIDKTKSTLQEGILCIDTLITFKELEQKEELIGKNVNLIQDNMEIIKENKDVVYENVEISKETASSLMETEDKLDGVHRNTPIEFQPIYDKLLFGIQAQTMNETTPKRQHIKIFDAPPNPKKIKLVQVRKSLDFGISYKLGDVFSRITKKEPVEAHRADADVHMLVMCAATLGDKFVDWCNRNAKMFCDIPPMVPGRKIGT